MTKIFYLFLFPVTVFCSACQFSDQQERSKAKNKIPANEIASRDSAILFFVDTEVNDFFQKYPITENYRKELLSFYNKRSNAFAWINDSGINEYGKNFVNLLTHEKRIYHDDCILYPEQLQSLFDSLSKEGNLISINDRSAASLEFILTVNFFDYARRNWHGRDADELESIGWFIERPGLNYEEVLEAVLKSDPQKIDSFRPLYRQYGLLRKFLLRYNTLEKEGSLISWPDKISALRRGDTSASVPAVKKQLYLFGDLENNDGTPLFDNALEEALRKFQKRHGLKDDGIFSENTFRALRVSLHDRIQQLLINMERCRWVPTGQKGEYVVVNIPAFKLFFYHNDSLEWSCNVIVGKQNAASNTVIFNADLEYIVFNPYWNVPENIVLNEMLPQIKKSDDYLLKHNMEVVDISGHAIVASSIDWKKYTTHFPYIIRQRPGKNNSLGMVKFLFPNPYDIYMHDTPEKSLFDESTRTFSHGCIRLEEPYKLAAILLKGDTAWTKDKINTCLSGGKQAFVKLKNKIPVFIAYFTAWVDRAGALNFRDDIYHHDAKMKRLLFYDGDQ
ncbi:MAG: L,D-transpeptidase family protein [Bacteroidetes bacterium]|nr:L,D-transpeptidase family protein [Bacteroidota bacterium]